MKTIVLIFVCFSIFTSCNTQQSSVSTNSETRLKSNVDIKRKDGGEIIGDENGILVCVNGICEETCISVVMPEFQRWNVYGTYWMKDDLCYIMLISSQIENNEKHKYFYRMYSGNVVRDYDKKGHCEIPSFENPDYEGTIKYSEEGSIYNGLEYFLSFYSDEFDHRSDFKAKLSTNLFPVVFDLKDIDGIKKHYWMQRGCVKFEEIDQDLLNYVNI